MCIYIEREREPAEGGKQIQGDVKDNGHERQGTESEGQWPMEKFTGIEIKDYAREKESVEESWEAEKDDEGQRTY